MKAITPMDLLEAAACALISERCRLSYVHDIRGGLQALYVGVELLSRAAKSPANSALMDKAAGLATGALAKHEKYLVELVDQMTPRPETAVRVNVGVLLGEILRFIQNDVANRSIAIELQAPDDILVLAQAHKIHLFLLGLSITLTDGLAAGTSVRVTVTRSNLHVLIEYSSVVPCPVIPTLDEIWGSPHAIASPRELLLSLTQAWAQFNGGRLDVSVDADDLTAVRVYYPALAP